VPRREGFFRRLTLLHLMTAARFRRSPVGRLP
jgi:hypothetical protein